MLVLGRKKGESIILGEDIFIKVLEIGSEPHELVRLAIEAPDDVNIVRTEILLSRKELREKLSEMQSSKVSKRIRKEIRELETTASNAEESA